MDNTYLEPPEGTFDATLFVVNQNMEKECCCSFVGADCMKICTPGTSTYRFIQRSGVSEQYFQYNRMLQVHIESCSQ